MSKKIITFDKAARKELLDAFDMTTDEQGYIVERSNPKKRVLTPTGDEVKLENLAGIKNGSLLFFKTDLPSLIELADRLK
jgi:hypothetical protein